MAKNTMMSNLKDNFKNFENKFKVLITNKRELTNKNKNVENDFIRIYNIKSNESIAFGFNNLEDLNGLITVSFTDTSGLTYSNTFNFEIFKSLFKSLIKEHSNFDKSFFINFFSLSMNDRDANKSKFKELFFEENNFLILSYLENKKRHLAKLSEVKDLSLKHSKLVSEYSNNLKKELGLSEKQEELIILEKNYGKSREIFYGSLYNKETVISQFYNKTYNLKTTLGFNIFQSHIICEIESL
jgi:HD-GYP domain-containing protein (c-di-GMP phosphodiesterase class II)